MTVDFEDVPDTPRSARSEGPSPSLAKQQVSNHYPQLQIPHIHVFPSEVELEFNTGSSERIEDSK